MSSLSLSLSLSLARARARARVDGKTVDRSGICIIHLERWIPARAECLVSHRGLRSGEFIARLVTPMRLARLALALSFSLSRSRGLYGIPRR